MRGSGQRRGRRAAFGVVALAVVGVIAGLWTAGANAQSTFTLKVAASAGTATDAVTLEGETYAAAKTAADTAAQAGSATVPVGVVGLGDLTSSSAVLTSDDTARSLAFRGPATVLGTPAQILVTATWDSATDTDPDVAALVRFNSVSLATLNPGWQSVPVSFGPAIVGLTDASHTVEPSAALGTDAFLADGLADTDDAFAVSGTGVSLSAVVSDGVLTDAASELGETASGIRLRGTLANSPDVLEGGGGGAGLDLAVDIPVATPASFPGWLKLSSPWTLTLAANTSGDFVAGFAGGIVATPDGDGNPITVDGAASVSVIAGQTTLNLSAELGPIADLFGQTWLDLNGAAVNVAIANGSVSGGIEASLTLGTVTSDISLALTVGGGTTNASLDLLATGPLSSSDILTAIGAPTSGIDPGLVNVTLRQLAFHVAVDKPQGAPADVTVSAFADASLSINSGSFDAAMLFRMQSAGGTKSLLAAGRLTAPTLKQLDPEIAFDWKLPDVALVASTTGETLVYDDLDKPTQLYFAPVLCDETGTCSDLELVQGLQIQAAVELPADFSAQLDTLGIAVDGPVELTGTLPVLGGTTLALEVALPTVSGGPSDLVKQGNVSFSITADKVTKEVKASIDGNMVFRVTRSDTANCDGTEDGTWPNSAECYDELDLTVAAAVSTSPTSGAQIELSGTISQWDHAFGLDWLQIRTLRLELALKAGGGSPVSLQIGMLGQMVIGTSAQASDLTLAIKLEITPTPPWINVIGFTAASADGIGLRTVAQAFDPTLDTSLLPDLSLKNIWLSYGTETDTNLCIRQGVFISAELHLGAPTPGGSDPGCIPGATVPDDPSQLPTAGCEAANTCLAAVLIDVGIADTPSFTGAGFIRQFDAGPIHIASTSVALSITPDSQRLYLSGGATVNDITGVTNDVWASGALTIDFRNQAGNASLFVDGQVNIGGSEGLTARLTGTVAADFSKLQNQQLVEFLKSLNYDLTADFSFPALDKFGNDVNQAFVPVGDWLDSTGQQITDAFDPNSNTSLESFAVLFKGAPTPEYGYLTGYSGALGEVATSIQTQSKAYYDYIAGYWQLKFYDVTLSNGTTQNAWEYYLAQVNTVTQNTVQSVGLGGIALGGIDSELIPSQQFFFGAIPSEKVNAFRLTVPSLCAPGGSLAANPVCNGGGVDGVADVTLAPLAGQQFTTDTGYTLPTVTGVSARTAAAPAASRIAAPTPLAAAIAGVPANAIDAITDLQAAFTTDSVDVRCVTVQVHYSPQGNVQDPAVVTLDAFGAQTTVAVDLNTDNPAQPIAPTETVQSSIDTILNAETPPEPCTTPDQPVGPGGTTVAVDKASVDEGGTVTASGVADARFAGQTIAVTWGDGATSSAPSGPDGRWSATHRYPDDTGVGGSSRFLISASAPGVLDANFTRVTVNNVAPSLAGLSVAPATVNEGSSLTVSGRFTDPGELDSHTLVVSWGDGTPDSTVSFAAGASSSFSLSHPYPDDDPTLTPSDKLSVTVRLTDNDGGRATSANPVTVANVAPTGLRSDSITIGGTAVARSATGQLIVPEGSTVVYNGSFRDPGVRDTQRVSIDWGDGTREGTAVATRDAADPTLYRFAAQHLYVDDNPTSTPSDVYTLTVFANDDDQGTATFTEQVRLDDVAPVVTVDPVAPTTENVGISVGATFTDVGVADSHSATVDWGDGKPAETVALTAETGRGSLRAPHTYGDDGTYTVTVTVTDDDTVAGQATTKVVVANTVPTVAIDSSAGTTFDGVRTLVGVQNTAIPFKGSAIDPGSDDLVTTWAFGDGLTSVATSLVNPPATDPKLSPSIQPRSITADADHAYAKACLYRATLSATDDDGGAATPAGVDVVVLALAHRWESNGFWKNAYQGKGGVAAADLACYLKIVAHTSEVFGPGDALALDTSAQAATVLAKDTGTDREQLDRELLVAWLNIANGALPLTTPLDTNGDGRPDRTAAAVLADAERVRLNPAATQQQLQTARKTVQDLGKLSTVR